eukprot:scaffold78267_cov20-Tisochrysis_lutea.AAC.1
MKRWAEGEEGCNAAARLEAVGAKAKDSDTSNKVEAQDVRGGGDTAHTPSNLLKMLRPLPVPRPLFLAAPGVANAQRRITIFPWDEWILAGSSWVSNSGMRNADLSNCFKTSHCCHAERVLQFQRFPSME